MSRASEDRPATLREISHELLAAMESAAVAETEEEADQAQALIWAWTDAEIAKVDRIRDFVRHCEVMEQAAKEEYAVQKMRAEQWAKRRERLLECCRLIMEQTGRDRIEGRTGYLLLRGNGGKRAVEIDQPELVPDEYCSVDAEISGPKAVAAAKMLSTCTDVTIKWVRRPVRARIAEALERGEGVPGCTLRERGAHVEVKP